MSGKKRPNIYTRANAGKWVAAERKTGKVIARGVDVIAVDHRARAKGYTDNQYLLARVPEAGA